MRSYQVGGTRWTYRGLYGPRLRSHHCRYYCCYKIQELDTGNGTVHETYMSKAHSSYNSRDEMYTLSVSSPHFIERVRVCPSVSVSVSVSVLNFVRD